MPYDLWNTKPRFLLMCLCPHSCLRSGCMSAGGKTLWPLLLQAAAPTAPWKTDTSPEHRASVLSIPFSPPCVLAFFKKFWWEGQLLQTLNMYKGVWGEETCLRFVPDYREEQACFWRRDFFPLAPPSSGTRVLMLCRGLPQPGPPCIGTVK